MRSAKSEIKFLEKQVEELENAARKIISSNPNLDKQFKLLTEIKGVGEKLALAIIADMLDIKNSEKSGQFTAFAEITPSHFQSGSSVNGKSHLSKMGSQSVKKILYMNALLVKITTNSLKNSSKNCRKKAKLQRSSSAQSCGNLCAFSLECSKILPILM